MNPNTSTFYYKERSIIDNTKEIIEFHQLNNYPDVLKKKVTILKHFKDYLLKDNENIIKTNKVNENNNQNEPYTYVFRWMKTEQVTMFRLSNKIVHFFFVDKTEIILVTNSKAVIYVNEKRERYLDHVKNAINSNDSAFYKKLKHAKGILQKIEVKHNLYISFNIISLTSLVAFSKSSLTTT